MITENYDNGIFTITPDIPRSKRRTVPTNYYKNGFIIWVFYK